MKLTLGHSGFFKISAMVIPIPAVNLVDASDLIIGDAKVDEARKEVAFTRKVAQTRLRRSMFFLSKLTVRDKVKTIARSC
jgi:hypothetical protein